MYLKLRSELTYMYIPDEEMRKIILGTICKLSSTIARGIISVGVSENV